MKEKLTKFLETYFDKIIVLHYVKNTERKVKLDKELDRIGINQCKNLEFYYDVDTPYDEAMFQNIMLHYPSHPETHRLSYKKASFHHYRIIKIAYEQGCNRILILEDDACFLKNLEKLLYLFECTPKDADIVLYDKLIWRISSEKYKQIFKNCIYANYTNLNLFLLAFISAACYGLSRKAMEELIINYDNKLTACDTYTNYVPGLSIANFAKRYVANTNLCIQDSPGYYEDFYKTYINFDEYNLPDDNPYKK